MRKLSSERLKKLCKLKQKKFRNEERLVLAEGIRTISQLITDGVEIEEVYSSDFGNCEINNICTMIPVNKQLETNDDKLLKLSATPAPQSIMALIKMPEQKINKFNRLLYLDGISDPTNIGAIFRVAAAVDIDGVIIPHGTCDIFNPKAIRSSVGKVFTVPTMSEEEFDIDSFQGDIIVADGQGDITLNKLTPSEKPFLLVLGSEAFGVSNRLNDKATKRVHIPMKNNLESLNVAIAAALLMYQLSGSLMIDK